MRDPARASTPSRAGRAPAPSFAASLAVLALTSGCVRDEAPREGSIARATRREVYAWELPPAPEAPMIALWPKGAGAPQRTRRHLATKEEHGELVATVDGADPCFQWALAAPTGATGFTFTVRADGDTDLQVFWASAQCPVFSEACSIHAPVTAGRSTRTALLPVDQKLRAIRLDLPDVPGTRLVFEALSLRLGAEVESTWTPSGELVDAVMTSSGLRVTSLTDDPWLTVEVPGLRGDAVTAVEVVLSGPGAGPPRLYWDGPCGGFAERCSVTLTAADAGAATHRGNLAAHPDFRGPIGRLRLDPGPSTGEYWLERVALIHDPADAVPPAGASSGRPAP